MVGLPKDYKKIGIFGEAEATKEQAAALIYLNNTDPQLNCSVDELVDLYWTEAGREGVREDIALAQAIIETGFFSFTGDVKPEQNNYCGLGTTGGGVEGEYFDEPEIGVRAHIQHLLAYTTKKHPSTDIVDPRYELAHAIRMERGIVDKWSGLNGTWAMGSQYCEKIMRIYQSMLTLNDKDLKEAEKAKDAAASLFAPGSAGNKEGIPSVSIPKEDVEKGIGVLDLYTKSGLTSSNGEARRLVMQGGAEINGKKITDPKAIIDLSAAEDGEFLLKAGKKRFMRVIPE